MDTEQTQAAAQPPPLPTGAGESVPIPGSQTGRRFSSEQDVKIVAIGDKYLDAKTQRVKWGLALGENPELFEELGATGNDGIKPIIDRYNYIRRGKSDASHKPISRKASNFSTGNRWETDELDAYFEAVIPFVHGIHVDWKGFFNTPMADKLKKRHKKTDITSRFYYEKGKGKASRLWNKIVGCGPRYVKARPATGYAPAAPPPEVMTTAAETQKPETEVSFCPYCGHNLQGLLMADRLLRDR